MPLHDDDGSMIPSSRSVDLETLQDLRTVLADDVLVAEIIETFLVDTPLRLEVMERASRELDADTAAQQAHAIKAAAATLGLSELAAACGRLESAGSHGVDAAGHSLVVSIRASYSAANETLRWFLATLR